SPTSSVWTIDSDGMKKAGATNVLTRKAMTKATASRSGSSPSRDRGFGGGSSTGAGPPASGMTAGQRDHGRRVGAAGGVTGGPSPGSDPSSGGDPSASTPRPRSVRTASP